MIEASGSTDGYTMAHTKRTCDVQDEDIEFLKKFEEEISSLSGMVEEMIVETPAILLSPVMRKLLVEKARLVAAMHDRVRYRLCIDNPGEPLVV
jgi:hypothetical protein